MYKASLLISFLHFKDKQDIEGIITTIINDYIRMGEKMIIVITTIIKLVMCACNHLGEGAISSEKDFISYLEEKHTGLTCETVH